MIDLEALKEQLRLLGHNLPDAQVVAILREMNIDCAIGTQPAAPAAPPAPPKSGSILDTFQARPAPSAKAASEEDDDDGEEQPHPLQQFRYGYTGPQGAALGASTSGRTSLAPGRPQLTTSAKQGEDHDSEDEVDADGYEDVFCRHCDSASCRRPHAHSRAVPAAPENGGASDWTAGEAGVLGRGGVPQARAGSKQAWAGPSTQPGTQRGSSTASGLQHRVSECPAGSASEEDDADDRLAWSLGRLGLGASAAQPPRQAAARGPPVVPSPSASVAHVQPSRGSAPPRPASAGRVRDQTGMAARPGTAQQGPGAAASPMEPARRGPAYEYGRPHAHEEEDEEDEEDDDDDVRAAHDRGGGVGGHRGAAAAAVHREWLAQPPLQGHARQPPAAARAPAAAARPAKDGLDGEGLHFRRAAWADAPEDMRRRGALSPQASTRSMATSVRDGSGSQVAKKVDRVQRYQQLAAEWSQNRFLKQAAGGSRGTQRRPVNFHSHFAALHAAEQAERQRVLREARARTKKDLGAAVDAPTANRRDELRWQVRMRLKTQE